MRLALMALVVGSILSSASGCNPSPPTTSGTADKPAVSQGWTMESEAVQELTNRATTYGSYNAKRGHRIRATVSAQPNPVDLRLYVVNGTGEETTLAEKKQATEAILEGNAPHDGTLMLSARLNSGKNTSCKYKIERR